MPTLRFGKVWQVIRHFGVLFFAIKVPLKQFSIFVTTANIVTPYISPYGYPNGVLGEQKASRRQKTTSTQMY